MRTTDAGGARRPRIGLSSWRRPVRTQVGDPESLYTLAEEYVEGVRRAGGLPLILPPGPLGSADDTVALLDGLVLTGGGDFCPASYGAADEGTSSDVDLEEDAWDIALIQAARRRQIPVFGICRGVQALNVALGGELHQDIAGRGDHPPVPTVAAEAAGFRHPLRIDPTSRLAGILGVTDRRVNSIHHQALSRLGEGLVAVAHTPDGTIEGVEYRGPNGDGPGGGEWWALGVQWHPERMDEVADQRLFDAFVRDALASRKRRPGA